MPESHPHHHEDVLAWCFASLRMDHRQLSGYEVLSGGLSGASTYRLRFPAGDRVLKVTLSGSPRNLLERARRELLFYRRLAPDVRVRVPNMIASHCDDANGICLLLAAYEPAPEPMAWGTTRFVEAAEQLGRLHAGCWGKTDELSALWWLRKNRGSTATDIHRAAAHWERLRSERRFEAILTPKCFAWVLGLLERVDDLGNGPSPFLITLCHGDFHAENVLLDRDGRQVLADWQEVGPGCGPEDLSFFIQRATFAGAEVPVERMFAAYHRSLVANTGHDVAMRDICRVADAAELRTRLLHWPAFLMDASVHQLTDLLDRIRVLAVRLSVQSR